MRNSVSSVQEYIAFLCVKRNCQQRASNTQVARIFNLSISAPFTKQKAPTFHKQIRRHFPYLSHFAM